MEFEIEKIELPKMKEPRLPDGWTIHLIDWNASIAELDKFMRKHTDGRY